MQKLNYNLPDNCLKNRLQNGLVRGYPKLCFLVAFLAIFYPFFTTVIRLDGAWRVLFAAIALLLLESPRYFQLKPAKTSGVVWLLFCWFGWTVFRGIYLHNDTELFWSDAWVSLVGIMLFWVFSKQSREGICAGARGLLLGGVFMGILALFAGNVRTTAKELIAYNTNELAYAICLACFMLVLGFGKLFSRKLSIGMAIFLLTVLVQCGSKKAFLGCALFGVLMVCTIKPWEVFSGRRFAWVVLLAGGSLVAYNYIIAGSVLEARMQSFIESYDDTMALEESYEGRGRFYAWGWQVFLEEPWGNGFQSYQLLSGDALRAHSDYICVLVDSGVWGSICYYLVYLVLLVGLFRMAWRSEGRRRFVAEVFLFGTVSVLAIALGRWNYNHLPTYIFLGMAYAMLRADSKPESAEETGMAEGQDLFQSRYAASKKINSQNHIY